MQIKISTKNQVPIEIYASSSFRGTEYDPYLEISLGVENKKTGASTGNLEKLRSCRDSLSRLLLDSPSYKHPLETPHRAQLVDVPEDVAARQQHGPLKVAPLNALSGLHASRHAVG